MSHFFFFMVFYIGYSSAEHNECLMKSNRSNCFTKCITNLPKKTWKEWFSHRHMRTKYLIFLGKWHQNRRLSGHNIVFSGLIIWDIFMMRYFQVSWDCNFDLNRLKTEPLESTFGVSPIRISDFVCMFGPIWSELNWPAIGLASLKYVVTFIKQHSHMRFMCEIPGFCLLSFCQNEIT